MYSIAYKKRERERRRGFNSNPLKRKSLQQQQKKKKIQTPKHEQTRRPRRPVDRPKKEKQQVEREMKILVCLFVCCLLELFGCSEKSKEKKLRGKSCTFINIITLRQLSHSDCGVNGAFLSK